MLKLSIVTPEKKLLTDIDVSELVVPTQGGEIEILPSHTALMATLAPGVLNFTLKESNEKGRVAVSWGYCEVFNNSINILAETAERPDEIDLPRAEASLKRAEEALSSSSVDPDKIAELQAQRDRALVRMAIAKTTTH